jgi:hypothetical protein
MPQERVGLEEGSSARVNVGGEVPDESGALAPARLRDAGPRGRSARGDRRADDGRDARGAPEQDARARPFRTSGSTGRRKGAMIARRPENKGGEVPRMDLRRMLEEET